MSHGDTRRGAAARVQPIATTDVAVRRHRGPAPPLLRRSSSTPRWSTRPSARRCSGTSCRRRAAAGHWTMPRHRGPRGRADPRPGDDGRVICGALRRRGLLGRGAARPPGDRRPADLHLRGQRPAARGRARPGGGGLPRRVPVPLVDVDARERFLARLAGVTDPEQKRKIIGREFIARVRGAGATRLGDAALPRAGHALPGRDRVGLLQGAATIKSHHNVGGLPEVMELELVEPLRELFKDEVRRLGAELGLPTGIVWRQPFPGPGLAIRVLGARSPRSGSRCSARRTRSCRRRSARPGSTRALAGLRVLPGDSQRRRAGRRAHLRVRRGDPRRSRATTP